MTPTEGRKRTDVQQKRLKGTMNMFYPSYDFNRFTIKWKNMSMRIIHLFFGLTRC